MSPSDSTALQKELKADWLTWSALNHLLPIPVLRELFVVIVDEIGGGTIKLADLFEECAISGPEGLESWYIRMTDTGSPLASYLQRRLQHFAWRNDADAYPPDDKAQQTNSLRNQHDLEAAVALGRMDFQSAAAGLPSLKTVTDVHVAILARLIEAGRSGAVNRQFDGIGLALQKQVVGKGKPIGVAIAKHLGDLCADADAWLEALVLYEIASDWLESVSASHWASYSAGMRDVLEQCIACGVRVIEGPAQAFARLHNALEHRKLNDHPVFVMNAPFDALTAQHAAGTFQSYDRRATLLTPTFYSGSYGLDTANLYMQAKKSRDALRKCWSVLRRQISLGLATQSRTTKSVFGRAILDGFESDGHPSGEYSDFRLALGLIIESGDTSWGSFDWGEGLVERNVDPPLLSTIAELANRYNGARRERVRVVIEIFRGWLLSISVAKYAIAKEMMEFVADKARTEPSAFQGGLDVGGRSLDVLKDVVRARPEFRASSAASLVAAIVAKLRNAEWWRGRASALELAMACAEVFDSDQLRDVISGTLSTLTTIDPAAQMWPVVRPALELLTCKWAVELSKNDPVLGREMLDAILRFGTQETQASELVFYLNRFDRSLLTKPEIIAAVEPVVDGLRKKATTQNSSNTAGDIQALLLSPAISGLGGVQDGLKALIDTIKSSHSNQPRIALGYCYAPVQMLIDREDEFASALSVSRAVVDKMWDEVFQCVEGLWDQLAVKPATLSPLSFVPRETSDSVLVHNWTFASLRFAESLGRRDEMLKHIELAAAQQSSLRDAIQRGLVTGASAESDVVVSENSIMSEVPEVFYDGLGRRLVVLETMEQNDAANLCQTLLHQCMRYGPRGLDAAVLVQASRLGLAGKVASDNVTNYLHRVDENRELRLSILPLLHALKLDLG